MSPTSVSGVNLLEILMKQQCHIGFVHVSWIILIGGVIYQLGRGHVLDTILWVGFIALWMWVYIRYFSSVSSLMGYGSIADTSATQTPTSRVDVVLYTTLDVHSVP